MNEFNEVFESFKKVSSVKSGYVDSSEPKTLHLTKLLKDKNKKEQ